MDDLTLEEALEDLSSAEDFLEYFGVAYDAAIVHVNRLHILQRFHDYIAKAGEMPVEEDAQRALYASLLERASEHSFYREMARLLRSFAGEELAFMALRVDDVDGGREVVPKSEISVLFNPDEPVCNACEHGGKS